jgi:hypothetical protein
MFPLGELIPVVASVRSPTLKLFPNRISGSLLPDVVRNVPLTVKFRGVVVVLIPKVLSRYQILNLLILLISYLVVTVHQCGQLVYS